MNKKLNALRTKLSSQLSALDENLQKVSELLSTLKKKQAIKQEQIEKASATPAIINPEQEISRLNFIVHCHQESEHLSIEIREMESHQTTLKERFLRINIELKMLEKHFENQIKKEHENALALQQKNLDEWVLLRRKYNGN
ncbi:MAG: hypothetical protein H0U57_03635 [Tatlockia sp.]|nr:hypothetical protein [Tatlockia sp.]